MSKMTFYGPLSFFGPGPSIDELDAGKNGVYLWCVKGYDDIHRVHYVGESFDIASRLRDHRKAQLRGQYTAFDPEGLRRNIKVLMHRAGKGMIAKYSAMGQDEFNRSYLSAMSVFYADLGSDADKGLRCRYEHAVYMAVEDYGQNILHVGHLRSSTGAGVDSLIETPGACIEALSGAVLRI